MTENTGAASDPQMANIENALAVESPRDHSVTLKDLEALLRLKGQIVLAGPPGVGKTWLARRLVSRFLGLDPDDDDGRSFGKVFHDIDGVIDVGQIDFTGMFSTLNHVGLFNSGNHAPSRLNKPAIP